MATRLDYYSILGIGPGATTAQVRSAYRRAALTHHPDRNPGDHTAADRFKRIQEAYEILRDPIRRAAYVPPTSVRRASARARAGGRGPGSDRSSGAEVMSPELAEAVVLLRTLADDLQLERHVRRFVRFLERL